MLVSSLTGLPLENILELMKKHEMVVDWLDFVEKGLEHGWKRDRIIERVRVSVGEVHGKDVGEETVKRLLFCLELRK